MPSIHTTQQSSWCRSCESFIPSSISYEEHEEKVHGVKPKGLVSTPNRIRDDQGDNNSQGNVLTKGTRTPSSRTHSTKTPSSNFKRKASQPQPSPKKSEATLKSIKKVTPARPSVAFVCKTCGRSFNSNVARAKHMKIHLVNLEKPPTPAFLHCYECDTKVEKDIYITHLMFHDADRKEGRTVEKLEPEQVGRKYLYLKPDDPRKTEPNAILQCPACPNYLFFSTKTYESHLNECKKMNYAAMAFIKSEPIDMDEG
ncbi:unnamed protein product [Allacma fusca]|uniref:C2H2-type domain-containing protein n=1 Tax=Allacma fusca TaxID=39272 RepID=A0A8J2IYM1_9HEXA|nr:unnamed protein product [Allacma fusca]